MGDRELSGTDQSLIQVTQLGISVMRIWFKNATSCPHLSHLTFFMSFRIIPLVCVCVRTHACLCVCT